MDRLIAELQRLYFLHDQRWHGGSSECSATGAVTPEALAQSLAGEAAVALDPVGLDGMVRTLALGFARAADWDAVANLHQGVQEDLELPAPAISVSGKAGYEVWFSLAEPVPVEEARAFLEALRLRYLAEIPSARLRCRPDGGLIELAPALDKTTGKWSAFIDPAMGSMFSQEPGLEMAPNADRQADLLAGFESIKTNDFRRVLNLLRAQAEPAGGPVENPASRQGEAVGRPRSRLNVGGNFSDPKSFLLAVMNDPSASAGQRIRAAKALLPYFEKASAK